MVRGFFDSVGAPAWTPGRLKCRWLGEAGIEVMRIGMYVPVYMGL